MIWKQADEPAPKKAKLEKSQERLVCNTFWDHQGVTHTEYLRADRKKGHTVTKERYTDTLYNLYKAIKHKCPGLLSSWVIILHDNSRVHITRITLADFDWIIFTH